ncbi:hypothetical protein P691DRAFT_790608 [Macrolepiota fuliginosa MF-IS2]|uniref:Uncharacterized protein n=1 Tax=Macrolepiota fuliginosa MF-IS2 TaxID=1400762 RepID=A0A9P5X1D8_9AGAR|nr:hypothetical protein P691DRAFT_790608 [Macrolepiota fuliginosa MF-IS2]
MACKPRTKTAASDPKLSDTTVAFLNAQNQDLCAKSIMQMSLLVTLPELVQVQVHCELDAISFTYEAPALPLPPPQTNEEEAESIADKMDIHLYNDCLASLLVWIGKEGFNNETNSNAQDTLIKHIFKAAKVFNLVTIITLPTPSPPPPCLRPHSDKEDIHMEPPTPAHVFSEAATQTPAPLPKEATPPPIIMSTKPKPMVAPIKSGPPSRPSFAEAAAKTLCSNALPFVQGPTQAPQPPPKATQGPIPNKCSKWPYFATHGPSRHQFFIETPVTTDLDIIEATLPAKITGSRATLSLSQSFIKIVNIPYFKPGTMEPPNRQEIGD